MEWSWLHRTICLSFSSIERLLKPDGERVGYKIVRFFSWIFFLPLSTFIESLHFFHQFFSLSRPVIRLVGRKAKAEKGRDEAGQFVIDSPAFPVESRETNNSVRGGGCAHPRRVSDK